MGRKFDHLADDITNRNVDLVAGYSASSTSCVWDQRLPRSAIGPKADATGSPQSAGSSRQCSTSGRQPFAAKDSATAGADTGFADATRVASSPTSATSATAPSKR
jgi:hypothetical protein